MTTATTATATTTAIHVAGIEKSFGTVSVLRGVDFDVARGTIFALLGSNGAGKTTLVRILATLIRADAGTATIDGLDVAAQPARVRETISLTGQFAAVDEMLTGRENLVLVARLRHLPDAGAIADRLLARFGLTDAGDRRASTYSGGMRRRLDIAMSLIGDPPVVFLDEPTTGLDPQARLDVWDAVRELARGGTTILLTTQYLDEADELADQVAVLDGGRVVASGTPAELKRRIGGGHVRLEFADEASLARAGALFGDASRDAELLTLDVPSDGTMTALRALLDRVANAGIEVQNLTIHTPDLDDVFFALTGRAATTSAPASEDAQPTEVAR